MRNCDGAETRTYLAALHVVTGKLLARKERASRFRLPCLYPWGMLR
jgi:hypothetical protein